MVIPSSYSHTYVTRLQPNNGMFVIVLMVLSSFLAYKCQIAIYIEVRDPFSNLLMKATPACKALNITGSHSLLIWTSFKTLETDSYHKTFYIVLSPSMGLYTKVALRWQGNHLNPQYPLEKLEVQNTEASTPPKKPAPFSGNSSYHVKQMIQKERYC